MSARLAVVVALIGCGGPRTPPPPTPTDEVATSPDAAPPPVLAAVDAAPPAAPPVASGTTVPCERLVGDLGKWTTALGEKVPATLKSRTDREPDATASCAVVRGGKPLTPAEQQQMLKQQGRLGVLPGDEVCVVSAFCWTIEDPASVEKRCQARGATMDDSIGTPACKQVIAQGADDVANFLFFDHDTRCVIAVRGGPGNTNNDQIATCASVARDQITPASLAAP